jgi:diacylglycerol O-acyltransferase/trehalose O-mycolyltransferase
MRFPATAAISAISLAFGCDSSGSRAAFVPDSADAAVDSTYAEQRVPSNNPGARDMLDVTIPSAALGRDVQVRLLLPASYEQDSTRTYPALYLLHGANDPLGYRAWTENTDVEQLVQAAEVLVVMPEAGFAGWYSDWLESCGATTPGTDEKPAWEEFHTVELPTILAESYRASGVNAAAGVSMGGLGAAVYAARHPHMFKAVASYSGALHTQKTPEILALTLQLQGCTNLSAVWGDPTTQPEVWASHDPFALADRLTQIPVYVSAGTGGPGPLDAADAAPDGLEILAEQASRDFVARHMSAGGEKLVTHFYGAGSHSWPYWGRELTRSLPMLLTAVGAE